MNGKFFCGCSGYLYSHWDKGFYPVGTPREKYFDYYVTQFNSIELNSTFYSMPDRESIALLKNRAPAQFKYFLRCVSQVTHTRDFSTAGAQLEIFLDKALLLGNLLGGVILQFPQDFTNVAFLTDIAPLAKGVRLAVELRNRDLLSSASVLATAQTAGICIVSQSFPKFPPVFTKTADFAYLRFHGVPQLYTSAYSEPLLKPFAAFARENLAAGHDVFAFFNNDADANAVRDARLFSNLVLHQSSTAKSI